MLARHVEFDRDNRSVGNSDWFLLGTTDGNGRGGFFAHKRASLADGKVFGELSAVVQMYLFPLDQAPPLQINQFRIDATSHLQPGRTYQLKVWLLHSTFAACAESYVVRSHQQTKLGFRTGLLLPTWWSFRLSWKRFDWRLFTPLL